MKLWSLSPAKAVKTVNTENCGDLTLQLHSNDPKITICNNHNKCLYFVVQDLKLHRENISTGERGGKEADI